jgi:hypothetical protein
MKRERFTSTIDPKLIQRIKILAIKQRKRFNELLEDAIRIISKYVFTSNIAL